MKKLIIIPLAIMLSCGSQHNKVSSINHEDVIKSALQYHWSSEMVKQTERTGQLIIFDSINVISIDTMYTTRIKERIMYYSVKSRLYFMEDYKHTQTEVINSLSEGFNVLL